MPIAPVLLAADIDGTSMRHRCCTWRHGFGIDMNCGNTNQIAHRLVLCRLLGASVWRISLWSRTYFELSLLASESSSVAVTLSTHSFRN